MNEGGTIFCDLDGTIFEHGTGNLLPGAEEFLQMAKDDNRQVIFMTRRGDDEWGQGHKYSEAIARGQLAAVNLGHHQVIFNVHSPRIMVDDHDIKIFPVVCDQGFTPEWLDDFNFNS